MVFICVVYHKQRSKETTRKNHVVSAMRNLSCNFTCNFTCQWKTPSIGLLHYLTL